MATDTPRSQPSACIILGNPGFFHPREAVLRKEISDPDELREALKDFYRRLVRSEHGLSECTLDAQPRALQQGLKTSYEIQRTREDVRLEYALLLDIPPGLDEMDLIDPAKRTLPFGNSGRVTHSSLKTALPTLNQFHEFFRGTYRRDCQLFGLQNSGAEVPGLHNVLVISEPRAGKAIARMERGSPGYPNISELPKEEKHDIVVGGDSRCSGIFAGALWLAQRGTECRRTFAYWEADQARVKLAHINTGTRFASKHLGVRRIEGETYATATISTSDMGEGIRRGSNGGLRVADINWEEE